MLDGRMDTQNKPVWMGLAGLGAILLLSILACGTSEDGTNQNCSSLTNQNTEYLFCEAEQTWVNAQAECQAQGATLVKIESADENSWVESQARSLEETRWWIGLNDRAEEGTFVWGDGTAASYTNWESGEPNDGPPGGEDCVEYFGLTNDTWNDTGCEELRPFICEYQN